MASHTPYVPHVHDVRYDEALERLHRYGPDRYNGFVNHATMAVESLAMMDLGEEILPFVRAYEPSLPPVVPMGAPLAAAEQASALGAAASFPRWQATFRDELAAASIRDVLTRWLPVLAPGCMAGALHGVLMTAQALRALEDVHNEVRLAELVRGLAYWAATHQPLPGSPGHAADGRPLQALCADLPLGSGPSPGAIDAGVAQCTRAHATFAELVSRPRALEPDPIATLVATGAKALLTHPTLPIVFVHAVTGPVAFRHLARWVDASVATSAIDFLWQAVAGLLVTFTRVPLTDARTEGPAPSRAQLIEVALASRDEHAIKVVEAAMFEHAAAGDEVVLHAARFGAAQIRAAG